MKVALVTSHPVPFALGGAENLWWGLQAHIAKQGHRCDVIALPVAEGSLDGLVAGYEAFAGLDLSDYDCVITGKYPAWIVSHPNHVCYMLHRLRGLYDTYSGPLDIAEPQAKAFAGWMREAQDLGDAVLPEFFERYRRLRTTAPEIAFAFPGSLARAVVHFLDGIALSEGRIRRYAAISKTVAGRAGYFPAGAAVEVLYPPPHRDDYRCGGQDYFFTSSRLDGPKRIDLIIEAMRHIETDVPLLIAGTGPDEAHLKALAAGDERIRFLGFVPDDAMPGLYAEALAVPFVPYDEDYGLITIEAMRSGKPVLTVSDAGGPVEFVRDGVTGFLTAPQAEALSRQMNALAKDRSLAKALGEAAHSVVEGLTWAHVFDGLFPASPARPARRRAKPRLTVATTFRVYPPMGGGQARVFHLYRNMTERYDIDIVSLNGEGVSATREIAPGLVETTVPKTIRHLEFEHRMSLTVGEQPVGDVAASLLAGLTPAYIEALGDACALSQAGVACHPYLVEPLQVALAGKPLWYEAQDVERSLKHESYGDHPGASRLLAEVERVERKAWREARHVFACAARDLDALQQLYGPTRAFLHEVPNGVDLNGVPFTDLAHRRALQAKAGIDRPLALFMGSWHGPNIAAVEAVLNAARDLPAVRFVIVGSVGRAFEGRAMPTNVHLLGQVSAGVRNDLLATAHLALNPMAQGSGTNLKMLDYFAAGVPVLSSRFGARGLSVSEAVHFGVAEPERLAQGIARFLQQDDVDLAHMVDLARAIAVERYSWEGIANRFMESLKRVSPGSSHRAAASRGVA